MNRRGTRFALAAFVFVGLTAGAIAVAQDKPGGQPEMGGMPLPPEMLPGPFHKHLEHFVGEWDAKVKFWMDPSMPAEETSGSMSVRWIMDGRFIQEDFKGDMMGMPFTGMSITGYDNGEGRYVTTWIDSMSTSMMVSYGTCDSAGKVFTYTSESRDPWSGEKISFRLVATILSKDSHKFEMFATVAGNPEAKNMEILYTRKK